MKKEKMKILMTAMCVIIFCILYSVLPGITAETPIMTGEVFRLASGEWTPFTSINLKHYGVSNHIVKEAFRLVGVKVEFGFFPWKRSLEYVKNGTWDGTGYWSPNTEWEEILYASDPMGEIKFVFFHRKDNSFDWKSVDDLIKNKITIGLTLGYNYENPDFKQAYSKGGRLEKFVQLHEGFRPTTTLR